MKEFDQIRHMVNAARTQLKCNAAAYHYLNDPSYRRSFIKSANKNEPQIAQQIILKYLFALDQLKYSKADEWEEISFEQFEQTDRRKWVKIYEYLYEIDPKLPEIIFGE